ncbi:hypothetical protein QFC19_000065 [Naganishia cerealis]|uniref:Uncharacterized protein n=1 Tax=Naganishia cerealis TaxID=610337 RepID=A0ACC2WQE8_9TREE|nr:hypothetical protein QFC19_000065 [Naganishia cerealis]
MVDAAATTHQYKKDATIAVVGGGIGGVLTAIGLGKQGYEVHLFEQAQKFSEIGAGIAIYIENFDNSLEASEDATVTAGVKELSLNRNGDDERHDTQGKSRTRGVRLHIDKPARDAHPDYPSEPTVFECDLCIGCDGVKSAVRKALDLGGTVRYTGSYAYRGLLPMDKAVELCGEDIRLPKMWLGDQKHILTFPIEGGSILNMVAFVSDRSKPEDQREFHGPWVAPSSLQEMQKDYQGWDHMVTELFPLIEKPEHWALHDLLPLDTWIKGRVALLGDASLPHNGAGAGQAIEDALLLGEIFKHPGCNADTMPEFLKVWEEIRLPRANKQMVHSRRSGDLYEFASEYGNDYAKMGKEMETRWDWIWDHDHEADIERAYALLKERGF